MPENETLPELWGIEIRGCVYRQDEQQLDVEEFWDKFIEFVEANNWQFGGGSSVVDLNHPKDDEDV